MSYLGKQEILNKLKLEKLGLPKIIDNRNKPYTIWKSSDTIQVNFQSKGCSFGKEGYCLVCDYGQSDRNITIPEAKEAISEIISLLADSTNIKMLVLGTSGSILAKNEMDIDTLKFILSECDKLPGIEEIILETHYQTVAKTVVNIIKKSIKSKKIVIELGLESVNQKVLIESYSKYIDLVDFKLVIDWIKQNGISVCTNIMFGAPFISSDEQIKDTLESIEWAFRNNVDSVVLFPINIKPHTVLYNRYKNGEYKSINHWDFVKLLSKIDIKLLDRITLSWFGDRQELVKKCSIDSDLSQHLCYIDEFDKDKWIRIIPPKCCKICDELLQNFYRDFNKAKTIEEKDRLIHEVLERKTCSC